MKMKRSIPLLDLQRQYASMKPEIQEAIREVLESGTYVSGPAVRAIEQEVSAFVGSRFAVSTGNGTDALVLALEACGVGPGDEVVTTPYTFFATAEAIARVGAVPVFADIESGTYNLSPEQAEAKITSKTKAIIPVHLFGRPAEMDAFMEIARRHRLYVIEDACQAIGATYKGRPVGSIGHAGCLSFFPTKNLGGYGDGGMLLTNDEEIARKSRLLANHGSVRKYIHDAIGYNSRLDELQAAVLRVKLKKLAEWNALRREKAEAYNRMLQDTGVSCPEPSPGAAHVYHLYVLETDARDALSSALNGAGVATGHYYERPLHLQAAFAGLRYRRGDFPAAEAASERTLALPLYPELTEEEQRYIATRVRSFFGREDSGDL